MAQNPNPVLQLIYNVRQNISNWFNPARSNSNVDAERLGSTLPKKQESPARRAFAPESTPELPQEEHMDCDVREQFDRADRKGKGKGKR